MNFDDLLFALNKIFLALTFTVLLLHFELKFVNDKTRTESLNIRDISTFFAIFASKPVNNDFLEVFEDWQRSK